MRGRAGTGTLTLPPELSSPSRARRLVRGVLQTAGRQEWVEAAELAVTELVSNVALHAHTDSEVLVVVGPHRLRVEVRDRSTLLPGRRDYDAQATTGRGLALVGALASDHGVTSLGPHGKVVWFEIDDRASDQSEEELLATWDDARWDLPDDAPPVADDPVAQKVMLLATPATLWLAARQHHDALLRELVLYLAEHDDVTIDLAHAAQARGHVTGAVEAAMEQARSSGSARPVVPDGHPSPLPWAPPTVDLALRLQPGLGEAYAALQQALDAAERLAVAGRLLMRPGQPEIVAVRTWAHDQIQAQLAGADPRPWEGTAQPRFETDVHAGRDEPAWDVQDALASGRGVVAADDANRIVGISDGLAAALGWRTADLLGRRVVTLIPAHLREAHVAGFSRHLTTGEAHVLGVPLQLPVLHADGHDVPCSFLVEQAAVQQGRTLYLAWIEPLDGTPLPG
jgi:PAS domain S-box-containing protein